MAAFEQVSAWARVQVASVPPCPAFQAARVTLIQDSVTKLPLLPLSLSSLCSGYGAREQGRDFGSEFCCEGRSWKTCLEAFLTFSLALLSKLWRWKKRTKMERGERMQILAHKEILNYILVDQNTNQLKTTGVHQHAHKSFITIIQG